MTVGGAAEVKTRAASIADTTAAPRIDEIFVNGRDGWRLSVLDVQPTHCQPRAVVVVGHAMMADRRTVFRRDRRSLGQTLARAGFRVLVPELRGRGVSGPTPRDGADWRYEDLVDDCGVYVDLAQRVGEGLPIALVGHSLFGHVSLAWLGQHPQPNVAAWVGIATGIWNARFEPNRWRWWRKRLTMALATLVTHLWGYMPSARLGFGSTDEAKSYWHRMARWVSHDEWRAADGTDYWAALSRIEIPALQVLSSGDTLLAHPEGAERFSRPLRRREITNVGVDATSSELRAIAPDHMGLLTQASSAPVWETINVWLQSTLAAAATAPTPAPAVR